MSAVRFRPIVFIQGPWSGPRSTRVISDSRDPSENFLIDRERRKFALALIREDFADCLLQKFRGNFVSAAGRRKVLLERICAVESRERENMADLFRNML